MSVSEKILIIGNWKMKPENVEDAVAIASNLSNKRPDIVEVVVCPGFPFIPFVKDVLGEHIEIGAQDMYWETSGSQTGEVSPTQLQSIGCSYVILGHSSRRANGETDKEVNKKIKEALEIGLIPIVCIGEPERGTNESYKDFVGNQIQATFADITAEQYSDIVIAYEPVWAIGNDERPATPQEAKEMLDFIRDLTSSDAHVIYGGSVSNDQEMKAFVDIGMQGGLIGRASLDPIIFSNLSNLL